MVFVVEVEEILAEEIAVHQIVISVAVVVWTEEVVVVQEVVQVGVALVEEEVLVIVITGVAEVLQPNEVVDHLVQVVPPKDQDSISHPRNHQMVMRHSHLAKVVMEEVQEMHMVVDNNRHLNSNQ